MQGNFIGANLSGTGAIANKFDGIFLGSGTSGNTIGGTAASAGNIISGNSNDGIEIVNSGTMNNLVVGNIIGSNLIGTAAIANKFDGILIGSGASSNTIGGTVAGTGNVISGNGNDGIEIVNIGTTNNLIEGNFIGSNSNGTAAFANSVDGVLIRTGASSNTIGGTSPGAANVISGNGNDGIEIVNIGTTNNLIEGNFIGCNLIGSGAIANKFDGILIRAGAAGNTIGGPVAGTGNVISGNGNDGIEIVNNGTSNNLIEGNFIGTNLAGSGGIANKFDGILIRTGASGNTIGGTTAGAGNVISGNGNHGIEIVNTGTSNNLIEGDFIGTNLAGSGAIANKFDGILIRTGASGNTIGGTAAGAGNVISGNSNDGIEIVNAGTTNNLVQGNLIGTNLSGTGAVANKYDGVLIRASASFNTIGGTATGAGNLIAYNGKVGIEIVGPGTTNNVVQGNSTKHVTG